MNNRPFGGVAIYVTSTFTATVWRPIAENQIFELLWVKIKHDGLDVIVGGLYHPPKPSNYKPEELLEHIDVVIEELTLKFPGALIVLAGDMNKLPIDRITEATGLIPIVHQPTRKENILDQILTSQPCYTRVQVITSSVKSDHKAIIARSDNTPLQRTNQQNKMCRYRKKSPSQNADFLIHMAEHGINLYKRVRSRDGPRRVQSFL